MVALVLAACLGDSAESSDPTARPVSTSAFRPSTWDASVCRVMAELGDASGNLQDASVAGAEEQWDAMATASETAARQIQAADAALASTEMWTGGEELTDILAALIPPYVELAQSLGAMATSQSLESVGEVVELQRSTQELLAKVPGLREQFEITCP
jgi:hypothetical protein